MADQYYAKWHFDWQWHLINVSTVYCEKHMNNSKNTWVLRYNNKIVLGTECSTWLRQQILYNLFEQLEIGYRCQKEQTNKTWTHLVYQTVSLLLINIFWTSKIHRIVSCAVPENVTSYCKSCIYIVTAGKTSIALFQLDSNYFQSSSWYLVSNISDL